MSKIILIFVLCCLCLLAVEAQRPGHDLCAHQNRICRENEDRLGRHDDTTNIYNEHCRRKTGRWDDITRCQLTRATCELTVHRCSELSCRNVERVLRNN